MVILIWLWGIVKSVLNGIARALVFALILAIVLVAVGVFSGDGIARNTVLELDLRTAMDDKSSPSLLSGPPPSPKYPLHPRKDAHVHGEEALGVKQ